MKVRIDRDPRRLRQADYPKRGDQFDALWKIVAVLLKHASAEVLAEVPADAMAVLQQIRETKDKFPREKGGKARW